MGHVPTGAPTPQTLYLIDGHSHLYRAYYAIRHLSTAAGLPTNAVYGMATMLLKIIRERHPDYLVIAFDTKAPTTRHQAYAAYKAHRPPMPEELSVQFPHLKRLIEGLRIPQLSIDGYEADDLIATVATQAAAQGMAVVIVSTDKDLYQLVGPSILLYDSLKEQLIGPKEVAARFGVAPEQMADFLGLMGDAVDNVPGVPGIGEKTAASLIARFGSIDRLLSHLEEVDKPKLRETLRQHADQARLSRDLATLHTDCPIALEWEHWRMASPDHQQLRALFTELEFTRLLKMIPDDPPPASGQAAHLQTDAAAPSTPTVRTDLDRLWPALEQAAGRHQVVAVALHTHAAGAATPPAGLCLSLDDSAAFYLPWGPPVADLCERLRVRQPVIAGHDLKPLLHAVAALGAAPITPGFDTKLAAYLLDPTRARYELDHLAGTYGLGPLPTGPALCESPEGCGAASQAIRQLVPKLQADLEQYGLRPLYDEVELPLIEVLSAMERTGILLDIALMETVGAELRGHLERIEARIYQLAGTTFNLNSPKQLAEILFDRLGLPPLKKIKTGYSTDESVLTQLALQHELPSELLNYRQLTKLQSTYVEALPALVDPKTGRLHTTFHQTVAATGRLSSSDPNLQNIPIRGEWGQRIRQCFIAAPGCRLLSSDYNQIELRLLAHLSHDSTLLNAFHRGDDVHTTTGMQLFGLPREQITPQMRRVAKTVNFAVIYGMSPFGLSQELGISQAEAKRYIDRYFTHYRGVKQFIDDTIARAAADGVVTTIWRRRRPIPELGQRPAATRALGERTAVNTVVQGSAADLIKVAMNRVDRRLRRENRRSALLLQIHDELLLEVPEAEIEAVTALVREEMEGVADLSVPLRVDLGVGRHWADAH